MKKVLLTALCALSLLGTSGCSSVPDGAKPLTLHIDSVTLDSKDGKQGFNVLYTVQHNSLEDMPVEALSIKVKVNNKEVANYVNRNQAALPTRRENSFSIFVPANRSKTFAKESLNTPMLQLQAKVEVNLMVKEDSSAAGARLNGKDTFEGIVHESN